MREAPAASAPHTVAPVRWTLGLMREQVEGLQHYSLGGLSQWMPRAGIGWRHGRVEYWSPDPDYLAKQEHLLQVLAHVAAAPRQVVALFLDEVSYTAWPDLAFEWSQSAPDPLPHAQRQHSPYRRMRVVGALDAWTGQVQVLQNAYIAGSVFADFVERLARSYPQQQVYLIWDNWPVHRSQVVLDVLAQHPRLHAVGLPTYSPWLNPIEKLWRKMRQELTAMHRLAAEWKQLQQQVQAFFAQFATGSLDLLRYVGLRGQGKLATALRSP